MKQYLCMNRVNLCFSKNGEFGNQDKFMRIKIKAN